MRSPTSSTGPVGSAVAGSAAEEAVGSHPPRRTATSTRTQTAGEGGDRWSSLGSVAPLTRLHVWLGSRSRSSATVGGRAAEADIRLRCAEAGRAGRTTLAKTTAGGCPGSKAETAGPPRLGGSTGCREWAGESAEGAMAQASSPGADWARMEPPSAHLSVAEVWPRTMGLRLGSRAAVADIAAAVRAPSPSPWTLVGGPRTGTCPADHRAQRRDRPRDEAERRTHAQTMSKRARSRSEQLLITHRAQHRFGLCEPALERLDVSATEPMSPPRSAGSGLKAFLADRVLTLLVLLASLTPPRRCTAVRTRCSSSSLNETSEAGGDQKADEDELECARCWTNDDRASRIRCIAVSSDGRRRLADRQKTSAVSSWPISGKGEATTEGVGGSFARAQRVCERRAGPIGSQGPTELVGRQS